MIRKICIVMSALLLVFALSGSCFAEEPDYEVVYAPVLEEYYQLMTCKPEDVEWEDGFVGLIEARIVMGTEETLRHTGYTITDLSGDGIPELVICDILDIEAENLSGKYLYAVYTCVEGVPQLSFDAWFRNQFFALPDGSFLNIGSNGAAYAVLALHQPAPDGTGLECTDYYFTYQTDETMQEIAVFYNTIGQSDPTVSEQTGMTLEELWQMDDIYSSMVVEFPLTSFAERYGLPSRVQAEWSQNEKAAVFTATGNITDFTFLSLRLESVSENGDAEYTVTEETAYGNLTQESKLVVPVTFLGDLPEYGISYIDSAGISQFFTLSISGKDGSLVLMPN